VSSSAGRRDPVAPQEVITSAIERAAQSQRDELATLGWAIASRAGVRAVPSSVADPAPQPPIAAPSLPVPGGCAARGVAATREFAAAVWDDIRYGRWTLLAWAAAVSSVLALLLALLAVPR
jgi:hypothetical protein